MPLEKGGRADKAGNRYEIRCIIFELLKVISEANYSVVIEALGDDEKSTDVLVTRINGMKEHQQCKARNASKEYWSLADLKLHKILENWKFQLDRDKQRQVALLSPIGCSCIVDLHDRAINSNGNPRDFYEYQIKRSSQEFCNSYRYFCAEMGLKIEEDIDILKSIDYLNRINLNQMSEYALKESIFQSIDFYFSSDREKVFNAFIALIIEGDICGKEITASVLVAYFLKQNIDFRLLDGDRRISPQIDNVNREYRNSFKPLREGLIERVEFSKCIGVIKSEKSFIITGNAGYGKSGCTEAILNYCDGEEIPYIALKLDRKIPHGNCEVWGQEMGFPSSISYVLHTVSKNKTAVIILDQLDALRWTQANSSEALSVCMDLIKQVRFLNRERKKKILIVFVCREYDLQNDSNINSLFTPENDSLLREEWQKIIVKDFDEAIVKKVVGDKYEKLTTKTKRLLQTPSNLYIWQHLDEEETYNDCTTTSHLIEIWFKQICKKSIKVGVQEKIVRETTDYIVKVLDRIGRLYAPLRMLEVEESGFDFLIYSDLIIVNVSRVGFVHQSILDYFISKRMMQQYYEDEKIEIIIGEKNKQTPSRRYQIQMFLQNLLEYNSKDFLTAGMKMVESNDIRYYVKYVFYEILRQISEPDVNIVSFIKESCKDATKQKYLINNVIYGRYPYVSILREEGFLEQWFSDENKKNTVFVLLRGISSELDSQDIAFIENHSFIKEEDDQHFFECFNHDITQESDEFFELRMKFYNRYPSWTQDLYIKIKSMMKQCGLRIIRLISLCLRNKIKSNGRFVYNIEEEIEDESDCYILDNEIYVLDELLQYIPKDDSREIYYSDWSGISVHKRGLERIVVELIKKANKVIINKKPELFWTYYEPYMGKNYAVYDEIILSGLQSLPESYSNRVITYLAGDIDKRIFDYTSGTNDRLGLVRKSIKVHTVSCNDESLTIFINALQRYISPRAVEWYKNRIDFNKEKKYEPVYWSFWGDLQYILLQQIPYERLSKEYNNLLNVLERKFKGKIYRYSSGNEHSGSVYSPVYGKEIGLKQWIQIITNKELMTRNHAKWNEIDGGFIESSMEMYSSDFNSAVKKEPKVFINQVIAHKDDVVPNYIDSMYSGAESSEYIDQVDQQTWEDMFREFPCDMESHRASYFCGILEKAKIHLWSTEVLDQLKDIALNHKELELNEKSKKSSELNCEELISKSLNCVKGHALRSIGHLLWDEQYLLGEFMGLIDILSLDKDSAVRMASFYALWPAYNIDKEWAEIRIMRLFESDNRMVGFQGSRDMFFMLYHKYRERVLAVIKACFETQDKRLVQIGGYSICEFFIKYNEFEDIISNIDKMSEEQIMAILYMAVVYLKYDEYREKSKKIILDCSNIDGDIEFSLNRMFYDKLVDSERDSEFLKKIMRSNVSKILVYSFVNFLEENVCSVKAYAKVIIALCESVLSMTSEEISMQWGIENDISKLIISLYDECTNLENELDQENAEKCLELWDVMFEKQIGEVRDLSKKLMDR